MSDLLERLKGGTKNHRVIRFPGTGEEVIIRLLSEGELQEAHFATERHFKKEGIEASMVTVDAYETEKTLQSLYRALRDPEDAEKTIAPSMTRFRLLISADERNLLVEEYTSLEQECSPIQPGMTEGEIDDLLETLKKRPEQIAGSVSNIVTARQLISSLVNRLASLQKDNGSTS